MKFFKIFTVLLLFTTMILPSAAFADDNQQSENEGELEEHNNDTINIEEGENQQDVEIPDTESQLKDSEEEIITDTIVEQNPEVDNLDDVPVDLDNEVDIKDQEINEPDTEEEQLEDTEVNSSETMSIMSLAAESRTSRSGHLNNSKVRIYKDYEKQKDYIQAGNTYTHEVYYIKKQAEYNKDLYYLISRNPSSVNGVVGWVKSTDMKSFEHVKVDGTPKTLVIKGSGSAYTKAWGGKKNYSYKKLSNLKGQSFSVNLTEKIGNVVWYRGVINGKTAWIDEANIAFGVESRTSRSGHINRASVRIYKDYEKQTEYFQAGAGNTNEVYYIKKQATYKNELYYLISRSPSSVRGLVGWVKSTGMKTFDHVKIDGKAKTFFIKGNSSAYNKAWGGSKNIAFEKLSNLKGEKFEVNLTERIGETIWYRGVIDGKTAWIKESHVSQLNESRTSRSGHLNSSKARIFKNLENLSDFKQAGAAFTHEVYYIKKQAIINDGLYYLISRNPSSVNGVVGWVKSTDMKTFEHVKVDGKKKYLYINGKGSAYGKAWGGRKNIAYQNLSDLEGQVFVVNLTERIGNTIWFRGMINGKTAWIKESGLSQGYKSRTSRSGHLNSASVKIFKDYEKQTDYIQAGTAHTHEVYYIKQEAQYNNELYYLISRSPSSVNGVVGWVKALDMKTEIHLKVDGTQKTMYVKGSGSAYNKAWGGRKNFAYQDLSELRGEQFQVHLTERMGNKIWYRGVLKGKTVWIQESLVNPVVKTYTNYNISLSKMGDIQGTATPQTDKKYPLWIREDAFVKGSISNGQGIVGNATWNLRRGPGANTPVGSQVRGGEKLTIYSSSKGLDDLKFTWYHVKNTNGWVSPEKNDLTYYINPNNFTSFRDSLQFLDLRQSANIDVKEVNDKVLKGKGILAGQAQAFVNAGKEHGINEIYLISHALLETGNGSSTLANGVTYKGKTVYNMFGTGAYDTCAIECGAKYAYDAGWFTPELAIIGGTKFIGDGYVKKGQNTIYKMRWDPAFASANGRFGKQYATDIGWAVKQTARMNELYGLLDSYVLNLDIPKYK